MVNRMSGRKTDGQTESGTAKRLAAAARDIGAILWSAAKWLAPAVFGAAFARTDILGGMCPFPAALVAAAGVREVVPAILGAAVGAFLPGAPADPLRIAACAAAAGGIRWALSEFKRVSDSPFFPPAAALAATLLTGAAVSTSAGAALGFDLLFCLCEGLLAAAAAYFLSGAREAAGDGALKKLLAGNSPFDRQEVCCLTVSAAVVLIPLCRLRLAGFSPFLVLAAAGVLAAAVRYREAGGAVAGTALGLLAVLSGGSPELAGVCAAAGLLAALFSPLSPALGAGVFAVVCAAGSLSAGKVDVFFILEATLAAVLFAALRPLLAGRLKHAFAAAESAPSGGRDGFTETEEEASVSRVDPQDTAERLRVAARGLAGVSQTVCEVGEKLDSLDRQDGDAVYRRAAKRVCADCAIAGHCWESARVRTMELFRGLEQPLRDDGALTRLNTPNELKASCVRWVELIDEISREWAQHIARQSARRRVAQVRSVVAEELGGVSELLSGLAEEAEQRSDAPEETVEAVRRALEECGCVAEKLSCRSGGDGRLTVELCAAGWLEGEADAEELAALISEQLGAEVEPADDSGATGGAGVMRFRSVPPCSVSFGAAQHMRSGETLCGDAYEAVDLGDRAAMLLSDGMGSGGRAAVDAAMTCGLLGRLLRAGFGMKGALRVVNSALLVRAEDESLATCDSVLVDLYTGEATFRKAGASRSFVRRGDVVTEIELPSLPLGILREVDSAVTRVRLGGGDVVVMVSDGAGDGDCSAIRAAMLTARTDTPRELARRVVRLAEEKAREEGRPDDDITALVFELQTAAEAADAGRRSA